MNAISRSVLFLLLASNTAVMAAEADTVQSFVLDPVNVTAMKYEKTALETPSQVSVYTAEELRKTGASDVANALKCFSSSIFPHFRHSTSPLSS